MRETRVQSQVRKVPWRRKWLPSTLTWRISWQGSLAWCCLWGCRVRRDWATNAFLMNLVKQIVGQDAAVTNFVVVHLLSHVPLCDPMDCSAPGFPVLHHPPELAQTHVHWVGDATQPSHPLLSPSPPALNLSQHQGLFQWVENYSLKSICLKLNTILSNCWIQVSMKPALDIYKKPKFASRKAIVLINKYINDEVLSTATKVVQ